MYVDHDLASAALDRVGGIVPSSPKVTVTLGEPDDDGVAEMTIEGDNNATEESVAKALGLPEAPPKIKRYTPTTVGYVVSEDHRPPSPGAIASRGRIRKSRVPRPTDPDVIEANVPPRRRTTSQGRK